ncbi:hypothetical protein [Nostoc piscinale]|uniref:hypothetical protein n=1 Tax=Nostoc piscinale TaxID=224012 RepID=UPI000A94C6F5|nr:hypothetical protein [Nostoc piscinale]
MILREIIAIALHHHQLLYRVSGLIPKTRMSILSDRITDNLILNLSVFLRDTKELCENAK